MGAIPYFLSYLIAVASFWGLQLGGWCTYWGLLIIFFVHPVLENIFLRHVSIRKGPSSLVGTALLLLALPVVTGFTLFGLSKFSFENSLVVNLGVVLSVGAVNGVLAINISHELIHRREKFLRRCGMYLLWIVQFMHWGVEHVHGHHRNVGTFEDPATARRGEGLYSFWARNYFSGFTSAFNISQSLAGGVWYRNKVLGFQAVQIMLLLVVYLFAGAVGVLYWLLQSLVAILLLLTVDYTEHYGLVRNQRADGVLEPVQPRHSWDSYLPLTNWALMNLGFHSHHHFKAVVPFYELKTQTESKKLPFGYSAIILIALVPPLYKMIMHQTLDASTSPDSKS